jgi:GTP cyclohydrolase I
MTAEDMDTIEVATRALLVAIGENPDRPGLKDTPKRVANAWREFATYDAGNADTTFVSASIDQMVVVSGMRVWSMCEHHLMPFWCDVSIGYIAIDRVLGLSKFGRIAERCAHRLTMQERLVTDIAVDVMAATKSSKNRPS